MMKRIVFVVLQSQVLLWNLVDSLSDIGDGECIWYDNCAPNPEKPAMKLNCQYNGPPKLLADLTAVSLLTTTCPELMEEILDDYGKPMTCCSARQIYATATQLTTLNVILNNCPACYSNMRQNFCYFVCHPRHSAFLNPTAIYKNATYNDSVWSVTQFSSNSYIYSTYESCENVYFPSINGPAMDFLCGPWGVDYCTPERLFDYFGNNDVAPFNVSYVYSDDDVLAPNISDPGHEHMMHPFNVQTHACNDTDPEMVCRCQDCKDSCFDPPEEEPPKVPATLGTIEVYAFVIVLLYGFVLGVFALLVFSRGLPGHEKDSEEICNCSQKWSEELDIFLQGFFTSLSKVVVCHPYTVLLIGFACIGIMSIGIMDLEMTTNPVELWAGPESRTRKERDYFDTNFGPFYRTNQIIIAPIGIEPFNYTIATIAQNVTYSFGPVFNSEFLEQVLNLQLQIMNLTGNYEGQQITLNDVCIKPMYPVYEDCLIESVLNYWQNDPIKLHDMTCDNGSDSDEYLNHLIKCLNNPTYQRVNESCMGTYGGPIFPYVALGGYLEENETISELPHYERSTALVLTFIGQNYMDKDLLGPSLEWEKSFLDFLGSYSNPLMDLSYFAERSIEDEIIREGKNDVSTILLSYFVMFSYVAISIGHFGSNCKTLFIKTKIILGFCSVLLVFLSVVASLGLCGFFKVEGTFFVIEVIPFLVLAVGVDNIFLLVQSIERTDRSSTESIEGHIARNVGRVVPSMLLATCSEAICFYLGALSEMPAIRSFAIYAGVALTIDFILQVTCLVALITLDAKRIQDQRYDVLFCFVGPEEEKTSLSDDFSLSLCKKFSTFLFKDWVRIGVIIVFVGGFFASLVFIPKIDVGLEQDVGMPDDSYVLKYFDFLADYLSVGPPIYFVVKEGFNYSSIEEQNLVCQSAGCNIDSILAQVFWASESPDVSYVATGANAWLDGYFLWISDKGGADISSACCRLNSEGNFINSSAPVDNETASTCLGRNDFVTGTMRPYPENFMEYLPDFLIDNPHGTKCPQAGHPTYGSSVIILDEGCDGEETCVGANNYMAYHTILKTSREFTAALEKAYELTDHMNDYIKTYSTTPTVEIFPYSIFYVFYEQYLTMWSTAALSLGISLLTLFLVMMFFTAFDFRSTVINMIIITMIIIDMMALMVPLQIQLNAISLVNLVMACGISVEFCSHLTHAFVVSALPTKVARAGEALSFTGSSVLAGITLTKFGGILVLAFANSQVIIIYYFRMYLMIVLLGASHGLIFLPVLLSLIGPPSRSRDMEKAKPSQMANAEDLCREK